MLLGLTWQAQAQDFHYSALVPHANGNTYRVSMWLPPSTHSGVSGLIMASHTVAEASFVRNAWVRQAADQQKLAIVYFYPTPVSFLGGSQATWGADTTWILNALDSMAQASGFTEINHAPWLTMGHSTSSFFANTMAWWKPSRTFGLIIYKGGEFKQPTFLPNNWLDHVPMLGVSGQYEEYGPNGGCAAPRNGPYNFFDLKDSINWLRSISPNILASAISMPGEGHFAYTRQGAEFIGKFIAAAAKARIPADTFARTQPLVLMNPDINTGWYSDTSIFNPPAIDSVPNYVGPSPNLQFFHLNRELAEMWQQIVLSGIQKTRPVITGMGAFQDCNGSSYRTNTAANVPLLINATTTGTQPVMAEVVAGPATINGNGQVEFDGGWFPEGRAATVNLYTLPTGTENISERMLRVDATLPTGTAQTLSMANPGLLQVGDVINLTGTSSAALPVSYTVIAGPGTVASNQLTVEPFNTLSGRSKIWLRVWQLGGGGVAYADPLTVVIPVQGPITMPVSSQLGMQARIYPNPAREQLTIDLAQPVRNGVIEVTDLQGRRVLSQKMNGSSAQLNLDKLNRGTYIICLTSAEGRVVSRFNKE